MAELAGKFVGGEFGFKVIHRHVNIRIFQLYQFELPRVDQLCEAIFKAADIARSKDDRVVRRDRRNSGISESDRTPRRLCMTRSACEGRRNFNIAKLFIGSTRQTQRRALSPKRPNLAIRALFRQCQDPIRLPSRFHQFDANLCGY